MIRSHPLALIFIEPLDFLNPLIMNIVQSGEQPQNLNSIEVNLLSNKY